MHQSRQSLNSDEFVYLFVKGVAGFVAKSLGVRHSSYNKYETGRARPEYENLVKLAKLYNVSVDNLLDNEQ